VRELGERHILVVDQEPVWIYLQVPYQTGWVVNIATLVLHKPLPQVLQSHYRWIFSLQELLNLPHQAFVSLQLLIPPPLGLPIVGILCDGI